MIDELVKKDPSVREIVENCFTSPIQLEQRNSS
jgi:hypothetical protein